MRTKDIAILLAFIVCILTISLLTSGGCGINFGNGNNNGGGGNIGTDFVQGTIVSASSSSGSSTSISGITVQATDVANTSTATTDDKGFFRIPGFFAGCSLKLTFQDSSSNLLGITSVTIFPGIGITLGSITIANGNVTLSGNNNINVTFDGDISENNCSQNTGTNTVNTGTIVITAGNTDVIVQVLSSTTIVDSNNNTLNCGNLLSGGTVTVAGDLLMGNTVQANRIELH
jgi:hypothetical protein